jgi:protein associated with RNAse G/E
MERFGVYKFFVMLFLILILLNTCAGCTYMVAKETVKVIDMALDKSPNPEKKKKILEKKKLKQNKAKEFYCSKVKDKEKCGNE